MLFFSVEDQNKRKQHSFSSPLLSLFALIAEGLRVSMAGFLTIKQNGIALIHIYQISWNFTTGTHQNPFLLSKYIKIYCTDLHCQNFATHALIVSTTALARCLR